MRRHRVRETASLLSCAAVTCRLVNGVLADHVRWMRLRGMSPHTVRLRTTAVGLAERDAGKEAPDLTEADLDSWQGGLLVLAPRTRATYAEQVKAFFRWAHDSGRLPADPSVVLQVPRRPKAVPHPISESDLKRALRALPPMVRLWLILAAFAGLRASEIAGLRREDILDDLPRPEIRVVGKGDKERAVPLSPGLWKILLDFGLPRRGPVFRRADGRPETGRHVSATANRHLHRLGLRETIHKARHRFASRSLDNGTRLHVLMDWLGHDSLASTQAYLEPAVTDADVAAVAAIDHPLTGDGR